MRSLLFAVILVGCGDTGQPSIEHAAVAIGTAARAVDVGDYTVQLDVARVGFGPATFCASISMVSTLIEPPSPVTSPRGPRA